MSQDKNNDENEDDNYKLKVRQENRSLQEIYEFPDDRPLGKGAFGVVWRVRRKDIKGLPSRALKIISISPESGHTVEDIMDEISILYTLQRKSECAKNKNNFNNCARSKIYDWFTIDHNKRFVIELEYISGGDGEKYKHEMQNLIHRGQLFDALQRITMNFGDLVATLNNIHRNCILHRDIKPENLLYDEIHDQLIFSDFGLSCFLPGCSGLAGSRVFMDPISLHISPNTVDERSDIYSLGMTMYELITGNELSFDWENKEEYDIRYQKYINDLNFIKHQYIQEMRAQQLKNPQKRENLKLREEINIQAPIIMLTAIQKMLIPWNADKRPQLSSILIALVSANLKELRNFNHQYVCPDSYK